MALAKACADLRADAVTDLFLRNTSGEIGGDDGARALAAALEQNRSLVTLFLSVRLLRWQRSERGTDASGAGEWHRRSGRYCAELSTGAQQQPRYTPSWGTYAPIVAGLRAGH